MDQHEHRPTVWRYLFHLDSTDQKNWTGRHTLVCKECGEKITRVRSFRFDWVGKLLLLCPIVFAKWYKAQGGRDWISLLCVSIPLGVYIYRDYRTTRYELLSEYHAAKEDDENAA